MTLLARIHPCLPLWPHATRQPLKRVQTSLQDFLKVSVFFNPDRDFASLSQPLAGVGMRRLFSTFGIFNDRYPTLTTLS